MDDTALKNTLANSIFLQPYLQIVADPANHNEHILIVGEKGTKKRLIAEILHEHSTWKDQPLQYFESEGEFWKHIKKNYQDYRDHIKGYKRYDGLVPENKPSNTIYGDLNLSAIVRRGGCIAQSPYVDEIISNQNSLAYIYKTRNHCTKDNSVRIIALQDTPQNPSCEDDQNPFKIVVNMPPLRRTKCMIPCYIVACFNDILTNKQLISGISFTPEFMIKLVEYDWPGNIDELEWALNISIKNMGKSNRLTTEHLPPKIYEPSVDIVLPDDSLEDETPENEEEPDQSEESAIKMGDQPDVAIQENLLEVEQKDTRTVSPEIIEKSKELDKLDCFKAIVSNDPVIAEIKVQVEKFAKAKGPHPPCILITGESGTGKELLARACHAASSRCGDFVPVQMDAIPSSLFESALFGNEKGAFTGATTNKQGYFLSANGGSLFLDEIGELDIYLQAKLLRAIQERVVTKVGNTRPEEFNALLIFATDRDLNGMVTEKKFRGQLFYRINELSIHIPPLRERIGDLPRLIEHFLKKFKSEKITFSENALEYLMHYIWPGNIRELENFIRKIVALYDGGNNINIDVEFLKKNFDRFRKAGFARSKKHVTITASEKPRVKIHQNIIRLFELFRDSEPKLNQAELGERIGIKRESVARLIGQVKKKKSIQIQLKGVFGEALINEFVDFNWRKAKKKK